MTPYTLRPARPQDAAPVTDLIVMAIEDLANQFTQAVAAEELSNRMQALFHAPGTRFSMAYAWVIEQEGNVAGACIAYPGHAMTELTRQTVSTMVEKGIEYPVDEIHRLCSSREANDDEYYIDNLAVFEAYRGLSYSRLLIEAAESHGRSLGFEKVSILADLTNPKAQAIYEKMGYVQDAIFDVLGHRYAHLVKKL